MLQHVITCYNPNPPTDWSEAPSRYLDIPLEDLSQIVWDRIFSRSNMENDLTFGRLAILSAEKRTGHLFFGVFDVRPAQVL